MVRSAMIRSKDVRSCAVVLFNCAPDLTTIDTLTQNTAP